jgi:ParB family chromosome partitioning protein
MSTRRGGLGRGLGALIPDAGQRTPGSAAPAPAVEAPAPTEPAVAAPATPAAEPAPAPTPASAPAPAPSDALTRSGAVLVQADPTRIERNPRQPREVFDEEEIDQLATSLLDVGMLQPLVVRPIPGVTDRYELVAGERRLRAALVAGLATVPAIVRTTEDADLLKEALVENIHRVQLNPLEEAAAYQQLLEEFGVTQEELAGRLGRSRPAISNTIRLLSLPPSVQRRVAAGLISAGHAKVLLALDGATAQTRMADRIIAEGLSVRAVEEAVRIALADGGDAAATSGGGRKGGRPRMTIPGLVELQDDLSDALEARVRIAMGARTGRITVEFRSVDDLERIVGVIADGLGSDAPERARRGARGRALDDADLDVEAIRRATDLSDLDED